MRRFFVKKDDKGFNFCFENNDIINSDCTIINRFNPKSSNLQFISNGKYIVLYLDVYDLEKDYIKMLMESELSEKDDISYQYIRNDLLLKVKDECSL